MFQYSKYSGTTGRHRGGEEPSRFYGLSQLGYTKLCNELQRATTTHKEPHNEPQPPAMSHKPQRTSKSHNEPQPPRTSHNDLQQPPPKLSSITLWTLCFICDKIISCFYGLLSLVFNALIFSFVKFKRYTYHNSCLASHLTKIKTSSAAFNFNLLTFFHKEIDHSLLFSTDREPVFVFQVLNLLS